jgi:hypothetical protein
MKLDNTRTSVITRINYHINLTLIQVINGSKKLINLFRDANHR